MILKFSRLFFTLNKFSLLLLVGLMTNCVSLSSHQTGRTLGENNEQITISADYGNINYMAENISNNYILINANYRRGLTERLDLGLTVNITTLTILSAKYQLMGTKTSFFASSIEASAGISPVSWMHALTVVYGTSLKSYNSVFLTDNFAITLAPGYIFSGGGQLSNGYGGKYSYYQGIMEGTLGFMYGKKNKLSLEISSYKTDWTSFEKINPTVSLAYLVRF